MKCFLIVIMVFLFSSHQTCAQTRFVSKAYYYQNDLMLVGSNLVTGLDSAIVDFYIIIDLKVNEITFIDYENNIFDWYTLKKSNNALSKRENFIFTFHGRSRKGTDCIISMDLSTLNDKHKFTLSIATVDENNKGLFSKLYQCKLQSMSK